jgi:hypothetical protein
MKYIKTFEYYKLDLNHILHYFSMLIEKVGFSTINKEDNRYIILKNGLDTMIALTIIDDKYIKIVVSTPKNNKTESEYNRFKNEYTNILTPHIESLKKDGVVIELKFNFR